MDAPHCPGCQQRDAVIARLEARLAEQDARLSQLEADLACEQQNRQRLDGIIQRLTERLAQYEPEVRREGKANRAATGKSNTAYSLDAEQQRRRRRRRQKSPGRRPTRLKFADAAEVRDVYPDGVRRADCHLVRERAVWRLEDGRALLVGYRVYAGPGGVEGRIPGVTPRCEYGLEILVVLAYLVYIVGISLDKAYAVLAFFCQLPLSKGQADALLRQLASHWEDQFELLCSLLAHAALVYLDETSWRLGKVGSSLWAFATPAQRVFLFGCHKDEATLDQMLPPDVFTGIGVSDDASVYRTRFRRAQKCWAHLLRKAIRLALLYPRKQTYQHFLDQLLALYHDAQRAAEDGRLGEAGRKHRVAELEERLCVLCGPHGREVRPDMKPHEQEFANLVNELLRLLLAEELFTFVLHPEVEPTTNTVERLLRGPAADRKAGRINQTAAGAHRRSVIVSVLESLRASLASFDLESVLNEVQRWLAEGTSLFAEQWQAVLANQPQATVPDTG